jgi:thiamine biosynthesis lipoprotein
MFGKEVEIMIYDVEEPLAHMVLEDTYQEGLRLQKIFNLYDPTSELSELNRKRNINASPELIHVIRTALEFSKLTEGRYDVTKGREFLQRKGGKPVLPVGCSYKDVKIEKNTVKLNHPDIMIDLGSIAKGYIADRMVEFMIGRGIEDGFIDARGDLRAFGEHKETINVQHPRDPSKLISPIIVSDRSVATSGDYSQYVHSYETSHIIGKSELISVTVVADNLMLADVLATCIIVLGTAKSNELMAGFPQVQAFVLDNGLRESKINGFEELLVKA